MRSAKSESMLSVGVMSREAASLSASVLSLPKLFGADARAGPVAVDSSKPRADARANSLTDQEAGDDFSNIGTSIEPRPPVV